MFQEWANLVYSKDEINSLVTQAESYLYMNSHDNDGKRKDTGDDVEDKDDMNPPSKRFRQT